MLDGYFNIGGGTAVTLPSFDAPTVALNLVGARDKGQLVLSTSWVKSSIDIPSRDKSVLFWSDTTANRSLLESGLSTIDSSSVGSSYAQKLQSLRSPEPIFIMNVNTSTHGSFALVAGHSCIYLHGLYDTQFKSSYLFWSLSESRVELLRQLDPLRFLVYRFPPLDSGCVMFVQAEAVCSKWWRWMKSHQSHLHAFNALEYKLYGHP